MLQRSLVALLVVAMMVTLVPVGSAVAESPTDDAVASHSTGIDAQVTERFRVGNAASGLARTDTDGVLEQPTRASIYEAIRSAPGSDLAELATAVDVAKSTVRYHVGVLRDAGLVETADVAGTSRVSPAETDAELVGVLRSASIGGVLTAVSEEEPASVTALADSTGRALSTVSHHLASLESRGYVDRERTGEAVVTTLTPETRRSIAAFRSMDPSADD
ncbi:MAG: winged helix-turn-helix transcriptional regulator [Halobacteriota archaeon]